jgi:hypothetical protein
MKIIYPSDYNKYYSILVAAIIAFILKCFFYWCGYFDMSNKDRRSFQLLPKKNRTIQPLQSIKHFQIDNSVAIVKKAYIVQSPNNKVNTTIAMNDNVISNESLRVQQTTLIDNIFRTSGKRQSISIKMAQDTDISTNNNIGILDLLKLDDAEMALWNEVCNLSVLCVLSIFNIDSNL